MSSLKIERLQASNLKLLSALYRQVYGKRAAADYFTRKYDTAYTGTTYVGFLALSGNEPLAFYGVLPVFVSVSGRKVLAAQSCDTMTRPDQRNRGLFSDLAFRTFELALSEGIHFIFGFPNQHSFPGFTGKLGFTHLHTMTRHFCHGRAGRLKNLFSRMSSPEIGSAGASIQNAFVSEGYDGVMYDTDYVKYKQFTKPRFFVQQQQTAWLKNRTHVLLGAISPGFETHDSFRDFVAASKCVSLTAMSSPGTALHQMLVECCENHQSYPVIVKNLSGNFDLADLKFQLADIDLF